MSKRRKATRKQFEANRANAQLSCGPTSETGKQISSMNSFRHGLTGNFFVMDGESQEMFDLSIDRLIEEQKPVGLLELEVIKVMAEHLWLRERASRFSAACFMMVPQNAEQAALGQGEMIVRPELERYMRYEAHHERAFQRAMNQLLKLRSERIKTENGFVSQEQQAEKHEHACERQKYYVMRAEMQRERHEMAKERHLARKTAVKVFAAPSLEPVRAVAPAALRRALGESVRRAFLGAGRNHRNRSSSGLKPPRTLLARPSLRYQCACRAVMGSP